MLLLYLAVAVQLVLLGAMTWTIHRLSAQAHTLDFPQFRAQVIDAMGDFLADILSHPRVKAALAQAVTNGMNHTMEQPDLGLRLHKVNESMRDDNLRMSRAIGEQLPGLAKSFVGGAMSSITKKKSKRIPEETTAGTKQLCEVSSLTLDSSSLGSDTLEVKKAK